MTDPAAIAARLTEAQKRALRDPANCDFDDFYALSGDVFSLPLTCRVIDICEGEAKRPATLNALGRAVLAELEKEKRHG